MNWDPIDPGPSRGPPADYRQLLWVLLGVIAYIGIAVAVTFGE